MKNVFFCFYFFQDLFESKYLNIDIIPNPLTNDFESFSCAHTAPNINLGHRSIDLKNRIFFLRPYRSEYKTQSQVDWFV